ncbi:uncharacterized protein [Palaemon carinicauda]|uniref:uncharacterized protein n=1 Tax=Palaemon carinicauda TaxID=392227 RepID=UPI0035B6209B
MAISYKTEDATATPTPHGRVDHVLTVALALVSYFAATDSSSTTSGTASGSSSGSTNTGSTSTGSTSTASPSGKGTTDTNSTTAGSSSSSSKSSSSTLSSSSQTTTSKTSGTNSVATTTAASVTSTATGSTTVAPGVTTSSSSSTSSTSSGTATTTLAGSDSTKESNGNGVGKGQQDESTAASTTASVTGSTTASVTGPTTASTTGSTNTGSTTTGSTTTGSTTTGSTTTGSTSTSTTPAARKRRQVDGSDQFNYDQTVQTIMETPQDDTQEIAYGTYRGPRVKRESLDMGSTLMSQEDPLYSFITERVEYSGLKTASDQGVIYDADGKASNCSCVDGSVVSLSMCLLNLDYVNDFTNEKSDKHKEVSNALLFDLTGVLFKRLIGQGGEPLFRRIAVKGYGKREDGSTDAILLVVLTDRVYQAEYHVKNAIEPSVRSGKIGPYRTDSDTCLITSDKTPEEPVVRSPVWWLRYICLPLAAVVIAVLVLFTCIGKRDAYYARMW